MNNANTDSELLSIAMLVLESAGYVTEHANWSGCDVVVARKGDRLVGVAAFFEIESLVANEPLFIEELLGSARRSPTGDLYLALLTSQASVREFASTVYDIAYNLKGVRRIVRLSVDATPSDVAHALRPLLSLAEARGTVFAGEPLQLVEDELHTRGVSRELVRTYLAHFRIAAQIDTSGVSGGDR